MSQTIITARIHDQMVQLVNLGLIASGSQGALQIRCEFDATWDGYGKSAVFYRDESEVFHIPLAGGVATVPHEVLAEDGGFYFGVMGTAENIRTTEVVWVNVVRGAITSATAQPEAPTPDIYQQLVAAYGKAEQELSLANARYNETIKMRGDGGNFEDTVGDEYIMGDIYNNGVAAYVDLKISGMSLVAGGHHYTDYCLLPAHAPLCPVYLETTNSDINVTIEKADSAHEGWSRILIENVGTTDLTTGMEVSCRGFYPLNQVHISELADARVDVTARIHPTAGEAIRSQINTLRDKVKDAATKKEIIEKLAPAFAVSGPVVRCTPVEGYPLEVVSHLHGNLFDYTKVPLTEASTTEAYITEVTANSIKIVTKEGYTGNGYVGTAKLFREFCPGLRVGDTFTISGTTGSANTYLYLNAPAATGIKFGNSYVVTEDMLNSKVILYGLHNGASTQQGVGTCTISNLQIERGSTATPFKPFGHFPEVKLTRCGKNLFGGNGMARKLVEIGGTKNEGDNSVYVRGENLQGKVLFNKFKENTRYTFVFDAKTKSASSSLSIQIKYSDGTSKVFYSSNSTERQRYVYVSDAGKTITHLSGIYYSDTTFYYDTCGIFEGNISVEEFEPYKGETFTLELDEAVPVYDGTFNWTTGILTDHNGDTYEHTPQEIPALPGVNTLYSSTGDTEVSGRADPGAVIADLYEKINQLQAIAVNNA